MDVSPHSGEEAQTCPCCLSMKAPIIVALGNPPDPIPTTSLQGTLAVMWGLLSMARNAGCNPSSCPDPASRGKQLFREKFLVCSAWDQRHYSISQHSTMELLL